jgi:hypothetical protein
MTFSHGLSRRGRGTSAGSTAFCAIPWKPSNAEEARDSAKFKTSAPLRRAAHLPERDNSFRRKNGGKTDRKNGPEKRTSLNCAIFDLCGEKRTGEKRTGEKRTSLNCAIFDIGTGKTDQPELRDFRSWGKNGKNGPGKTDQPESLSK